MSSRYATGVLWSVIACAVSALNDICFQYVSKHLSSGSTNGLFTLFFRFFMSFVTLLPFLVNSRHRQCLYQTKHILTHIIRGGLFCLGMMPWSYGLVHLPVPLMTTLSFTTPLFVVVFARGFLKESVGWPKALATLTGFVGIVLSALTKNQAPSLGPINQGITFTGMNSSVAIALGATAVFAFLDILNKKLLNVEEDKFAMMFFSSFWSFVWAIPFGIAFWSFPTPKDWLIFLYLGAGANVLLFCLLKAFEACDVSALQPLRYLELLFSCALSYLFFQQLPGKSTFIGALFIIPATAYIAYIERSRPRELPLA